MSSVSVTGRELDGLSCVPVRLSLVIDNGCEKVEKLLLGSERAVAQIVDLQLLV